MSDLAKLRTAHDLAGRLLCAGMRDAPSRAARQLAERALGLSLVTTVAVAAPLVPAGASAASTAIKVSAGVLVRWFGAGLLAGAVTGGGAFALTSVAHRAPRDGTVIATAPRRAPEAARRGRAFTTPPAHDVTPSVEQRGDALEPTQPAGRGPAPEPASKRDADVHTDAQAASARAEAAVPADSALQREIELLERVRAKVRSGDARGALMELAAVTPEVHLLTKEAELLHVEALLESGDRAGAERLAAEIERRNPDGSEDFRLRRLLGTPRSEAPSSGH